MSEGVSQWLAQLGLGDFAPVFDAEQVVLEDLPDLTEADLKELGIPLGPRKRILKAIGQSSATRGSSPAGVESGTTPEGERRQLTVMFCDLVGSTELTQTLDPEDLRDITRAYQDACNKAIERYEGFVARYMGDGVLAYFGFPHAHEDDAARALYAGLGVLGSLAELNRSLKRSDGVELGVRVGVATGFVVVGDVIGEGVSQESAVVGETPNLAARLQNLAEPNTLVISDATRALAAGRFDYEDLGKHPVKGFAYPIQIWRVHGHARVESQFEAMRKTGSTALVGRETEVALLLDRWKQTKEGEGQVVLLSGEAGIGKSRITQSLIEHIAPDEPTRLRYQCSPYHANTALHPVIERLQRLGKIEPSDPPALKLDKLETMLASTIDDMASVIPLFAALLSTPLQKRYARPDLTPEQQKEKTLEALAGLVHKLSLQRPVLVVFEDLHWVDPTSLELLELLVDQAQSSRILIVLTFRPDFHTPWTAYTHITSLTLNRLSQSLVTEMIARVTGGKSFSADLVEAIVEKTDGVPLFVEELTKTILESDLLTEKGDRYVFQGFLENLSIPITLHDSLMARLDRLGKVKEVAQCASVLGREFHYEWLAAVSPLGADELKSALDQLVEAELVFQTNRGSRGSYVFKHALVQDAAYGSLLKSTRQDLHGRIAKALEERFPEVTRPELLAHHYTEAHIVPAATRYWLEAGNRAIASSANLEAVAHFKKGLELVSTQEHTDEWSQRELDLQLGLTSALTATAGYAADETAVACVRARELCRQTGDTAKLLRSLYAVWCVYYIRPDQDKALELAQEFKELAEREQDRAQLVAAYSALGHTCTTMGRYSQARTHFEKAIELYDEEQDRYLAILYGEHPGIGSKIVSSTVDWMTGYPDRAVERARENMEEARQISHPNTYAWAACTLAMVHKDRQDREMAREVASELITFTTEQNIPYWGAMARAFLGWSQMDGGDFEAGMATVEKGLAASQATGSRMRVPDFLSVLALGYLKTDQPDIGLEKIDEAIRFIKGTGERWNEANVRCLRGRMLLALSLPQEAEAAFQDAIRLARGQSAKSYELRASTHLARLWRDQNQEARARELLAPLYGWFSEGFETRDLRDAKALLEELS